MYSFVFCLFSFVFLLFRIVYFNLIIWYRFFLSGMAYILFIGYMSTHLVLHILSNPNISIGLHRCYFFSLSRVDNHLVLQAVKVHLLQKFLDPQKHALIDNILPTCGNLSRFSFTWKMCVLKGKCVSTFIKGQMTHGLQGD
jgi:hypothetical protein